MCLENAGSGDVKKRRGGYTVSVTGTNWIQGGDAMVLIAKKLNTGLGSGFRSGCLTDYRGAKKVLASKPRKS